MLQDLRTYIKGNFTLWNENEEGENLFVWLKRKEPVLFNLLIIQQKDSFCFTKIYQKMQQIILHPYISFYLLYLCIHARLPEGGFKIAPSFLEWHFSDGVKDHSNFIGKFHDLSRNYLYQFCIHSILV